VKDDQYFIDERQVVWGEKNLETTIPILPRGMHKFPFRFSLPESSLPCSFESKPCCIRYYFKVTIDIPYASPPQGMKYFTVIGPHIDCMDEQYLVRVPSPRTPVPPRRAHRGPRLPLPAPLTSPLAETGGVRGPQEHLLLVLQEGHRQPALRPRALGLRLQGKRQVKSDNRQSERRRSQAESETGTML
jgi:hypothetical protein